MLSDESSSDSETGRFKCQSNTSDEKKSSRTNTSNLNRNRNSAEKFDRRSNRDRFERYPRDRNRHNRYSPVRSRHHRDGSRERRSRDRHRHRDSREQSKRRGHSASRERKRKSRSRSYKSPLHRNIKTEIISKDRESDKNSKNVTEEISLSPSSVVKRSEVHKPVQEEVKKSQSPVPLHDNIESEEEIQPGSYYSMVPTVVKEKSEESSEIDSSDDEKLRAKLLSIERELNKNKKRKHKKKHKRKTSKSRKEKAETPANIEVSSTTDILEVSIESNPQSEEVSSTQKNSQADKSDGEILSDNSTDIDPNDLRHKLKRSKEKSQPLLDVCGPALPPHLQTHFRKSNSPDVEVVETPCSNEAKNIGPSIPDDLRKVLAAKSQEILVNESSEDDGIGPVPVGAEEKLSEAHERLEERAYELKIKSLEGQNLKDKDVKSREEWMLELPEGKTKFLGLEARSFRAKEGPDMSDRSSWTDTPEEKARKAAGVAKEEDAAEALIREAKERQISSRDKEQEEAVRKHKKKHRRDESLLDLHQKKLKKKKKESEDKKERRPFSRDVDLQVNRFDEAQKKSIIKKAQGLNSRFSAGEAKYL
ncbi:GPALPP motifs-containing protein 1 isoform X2 [Leptidea sinapis]|uniref:GPALPP motifs-containing protein 1 isoform X2 n=1 Tax=Leptidea sinapis TaxID=189913 RepID=UPI0021C3A833|nr:GPALPP motifs-containing protein 1 isoform X2 [Leptidea sinapis]